MPFPVAAFNYIDILFGFVLYNYAVYLPEFILYSLQYIGIRHYIIYGDKEKYRKIIKRLEKQTCSSSFIYRSGKEQPTGYFVGKHCIGFYHRESNYMDDEKINIITTQEFYNSLCADDEVKMFKEQEEEEQEQSQEQDQEQEQQSQDSTKVVQTQDKKVSKSGKKIKVYMRTGNYKNLYYLILSLDVSHINPLGAQGPVVDDIVRLYKKSNRTTVFIHGVTSAGKSTIGYLVAKAINGSFCHTFKPTDPGDSFCNLVSEVNVRNDDDQPLVIVLEEANEIINYAHSKNHKRHVEIPISIYDKSTWCSFLDDMIFYKNVVLILTSNESKESIDKLDPAYLRPGRIDAVYSMTEQLLPLQPLAPQ
jgi:hypothetical protein